MPDPFLPSCGSLSAAFSSSSFPWPSSPACQALVFCWPSPHPGFLSILSSSILFCSFALFRARPPPSLFCFPRSSAPAPLYLSLYLSFDWGFSSLSRSGAPSPSDCICWSRFHGGATLPPTSWCGDPVSPYCQMVPSWGRPRPPGGWRQWQLCPSARVCEPGPGRDLHLPHPSAGAAAQCHCHFGSHHRSAPGGKGVAPVPGELGQGAKAGCTKTGQMHLMMPGH